MRWVWNEEMYDMRVHNPWVTWKIKGVVYNQLKFYTKGSLVHPCTLSTCPLYN